MEQTSAKYGAGERSGGISGNTLKMVAIVTMLIDHIGAGIVEPYLNMNMVAMEGNEMLSRLYYLDMGLRIIGRAAFPIFCFLLVEGFLHTHNVKKYGSRLLLFSLISEVPFDLASGACGRTYGGTGKHQLFWSGSAGIYSNQHV